MKYVCPQNSYVRKKSSGRRQRQIALWRCDRARVIFTPRLSSSWYSAFFAALGSG
jgi:hypothetical protein